MAVLIILSGAAAREHEAAVGHAAVVLPELLVGDEVDGGVIVREIVGHGLDGSLYSLGIRTVLEDDKALAGMLLSCGELRGLSGADLLDGLLDRDGVLLRVLHAGDSPDGVRVALAYALAPEGVVLAAGENGVAQHTVEGEETRIPADGDDAHLPCLLRCLIDILKVLGDPGVGVEAVDHIEEGGVLRGHLGKVGRAAAAEDEDVNFVLPLCSL